MQRAVISNRARRAGIVSLIALTTACQARQSAEAPGRDPVPRATSTRSVPDTSSTAVEGLFDVGGHELYLKCEGRGSFTVVYLHGFVETPAGGGSQSAGLVPSYLRDHAYFCSYDRANVGHSGKLAGPLTGKASVADLHRLLATAHVRGPYVLVGGSFGGLIALIFAATYPDEVAGLVLLDAGCPMTSSRSMTVSCRRQRASSRTIGSATPNRLTRGRPTAKLVRCRAACRIFQSPTSEPLGSTSILRGR